MSRNTFASVAAIALTTFVQVSAGRADFIQNSTGITSPDITLGFGEVPIRMGTPITDQYAPFGVASMTNLFFNTDGMPIGLPNIGGARLNNFPVNTGPIFTPFSMTFTQPLTGVAFAMITNPGISGFDALLDGGLVATADAPTDLTSRNNFFGFTNITFDEIVVRPGGVNNAVAFDNLQLQFAPTAVPEPGTLALLMTAGPGLVLLLRLRKVGRAEPSR
jgi:hypothetical protein